MKEQSESSSQRPQSGRSSRPPSRGSSAKSIQRKTSRDEDRSPSRTEDRPPSRKASSEAEMNDPRLPIRQYQARLPRRNMGTHLMMHRKLSPTLRSDHTKSNHDGYKQCGSILTKQRYTTRNFASQNPVTARYVKYITDRLYKFDGRFKPAESRGVSPFTVEYFTLTRKPIYTSDEVQQMVDTIVKAQGEESRDQNENKPVRIPNRKGYYPADKVESILQEAIQSRPTSSRPRSSRSRAATPVDNEIAREMRQCEQQGDAEGATSRMSKYDPSIRPPESKGKPPKEPPLHPEQTKSQRKGYSPNELNAVIDRLNQYDPNIWPPESKGCKSPPYERK